MSAPIIRAERAACRDPREVIREEPLMRRRILDTMAEGGRTVPEIAAVIGHPEHEALLWVMGMRRYGWIREIKTGAEDGYFRYEPGPRAKEAR
jgi:hypothetical protein